MKDFEDWHSVKVDLEQSQRPMFEERQVWWTSIGVNIGHEQDGKNAKFNRPVIVLRKFNSSLFMGVPMSTQLKTSPFYIEFEFNRRKQSALITHLRTFDAKRLGNRIGRLSKSDFTIIRTAVKNLF